MADAQDSGSCEGNLMGVQVPPRPLLLSCAYCPSLAKGEPLKDSAVATSVQAGTLAGRGPVGSRDAMCFAMCSASLPTPGSTSDTAA
jgi:hypothetical protein